MIAPLARARARPSPGNGLYAARPRMMPLPPARIKESPEDFVVEEIPAYSPSGSGEHVFVRFTKRDHTTLDAVRAIARALACDPRAAGFAGMKDKRAVATQTLSLQAPRGTAPADLAVRALRLAIDGITVHEATPHQHKMKPGHLAGNRFAIHLRGVPADRVGDVSAALERVGPSSPGERLTDRHDESHLCAAEQAAHAEAAAGFLQWNPLPHIQNLDLSCYDREYAPEPERRRAREAHLAQWPEAVDASLESLRAVTAPVAGALVRVAAGLA